MRRRQLSLCLLLACAAACAGRGRGPEPGRVTHGPLIGEVTSTSAIVWARGDRIGRLHARLYDEAGELAAEASTPIFRMEDWTAKLPIEGLRPDTGYAVRVWLAPPGAGEQPVKPRDGSFRTPPSDDTPAAVRLVFGGDLAGQNVCRDAEEGFPIFPAIEAWNPTLFVGLGDMIYADDVCRETGRYGNAQVPGDFERSERLLDYWAHWRYSREDEGFAELLAKTPYVAVLDDHEVTNDFGPETELLPLGLAAFLDYNPVPESDIQTTRLYRRLRWGRHLELFVLDTRRHRDPASRPDDAAAPKSLLGAEQRAWLEQGLLDSDATWRVIVSSVPMSIPTGKPGRRDGWADHGAPGGYEHELRGLLRFLRDHDLERTLWITTDVHFGAVFRYTPFPDSPAFRIHEVVTGPLNAGLFGHQRFDASLGSDRLFYFGPEDPRSLASWEEARAWFNFGVLDIDAAGTLGIYVADVEGRPVYQQFLPASGARAGRR